MNFFGHAIVASWTSVEPAFVLGSMVPDFANMVGARVPRVFHEGVARGVEFHHATDRVFHETPTFRALMAEARRDLRERGLPRPSALAVGHIGVEILLDATLAADPRGSAAYLDALHHGGEARLGSHLGWDDAERARYGVLVTVLAERGLPQSDGTPGASAYRITRALSGRPRLALTEDGQRIVRSWAEEAAELVSRRADALVSEIRRGLGEASV